MHQVSMTAKSQNLQVAALGEVLFVRVPERGCALCARQFEILAERARNGAYDRMVVELSATNVLESSMIGALADSIMAIGAPGEPETAEYITLLNANPSIKHSLETSGMIDWFQQREHEAPSAADFVPLSTPAEAMSKLEVLKCCLKAHKTLMEVSENNVPKFKDVVEFMEQDLKRLQG